MIKEFSNLQEFYQVIDPLLNVKEWKNVNFHGLEALIHLNLRLIVEQTENQKTARHLQDKLCQLSDRINAHFHEPAAHHLAFELTGIAMGIFSERKRDFACIPPDIQEIIFAELTPKGAKVRKEKIISSGLKDFWQASRSFQKPIEFIKKNWVNEEAVSLRTYGCKNAGEAIQYVIDNGLTSCNLLEFPNVTDQHIEKLAKACPNLTGLKIDSKHISDKSLEHLKTLPLENLTLKRAYSITDDGLEHLKEMPLTSIYLDCDITDEGLKHLKGMPLKKITLIEIPITDKGLAHFEGMPLEGIAIIKGKISNKGLKYLKEMPLRKINFSQCELISSLEPFKEFRLECINFFGCKNIIGNDFQFLKGMPLKNIDFSYGYILDQHLVHLKGMPLERIVFNGCDRLTDEGLRNFVGMPLKYIGFRDCAITNNGLEHFKGMPLKKYAFYGCRGITNQGLNQLNVYPS